MNLNEVLLDVEAALLTGGASTRMGTPKSDLSVLGEPLGRRMVRLLSSLPLQVTVLGTSRIDGAEFIADLDQHQGPAAALRTFKPKQPFFFLLACDIPAFDPRIVAYLRRLIGENEAAVPLLDGWFQPFCALYRSTSLRSLSEPVPTDSAMEWLGRIAVREVHADELERGGINPDSIRGANTREEFERQVLLLEPFQ